MKTKINLGGYLEIKKRDRDTGVVDEVCSYGNTVTSAGKERFLATVIGNESNTLDGTDGYLELFNSSATSVFSQSGTDEGPSHINVEEVYWEWHDESTDSYTPDNADIRIGGAAGTVFANITGISLGAKPSSQIWEYRYTLSIGADTGSGALVDDTSGVAEGLDTMLMIFSGESANAWDTGTHLNIYNDSETFEGEITSCTVTRDGTSVDYEWVSETGDNEHQWQFLEVASDVHVDDWPARYSTASIPMFYRDENIGSKGQNTKRFFTFTLNV